MKIKIASPRRREKIFRNIPKLNILRGGPLVVSFLLIPSPSIMRAV